MVDNGSAIGRGDLLGRLCHPPRHGWLVKQGAQAPFNALPQTIGQRRAVARNGNGQKAVGILELPIASNLFGQWGIGGAELLYQSGGTRRVMGWNQALGVPKGDETAVTMGKSTLWK